VKASPGWIVHYTLAAHDLLAISARLADNPHLVGNPPTIGEVYPAVIVRRWGDDCANLQVLLDGNYTHWVTSRMQGDGEGQWFEPPRVP
jgi:hypothetical protein